MEWSGEQQLLFLLQSVGLGVGIGLLFDLLTGVGRACRRRMSVFLLDVLFGVLAGLITFFAALAIMDGELHPLLFFGCFVGFAAEHGTVGSILSRWTCAILRGVGTVCRRACRVLDALLMKIAVKTRSVFRFKAKSAVCDEKNRKFFFTVCLLTQDSTCA